MRTTYERNNSVRVAVQNVSACKREKPLVKYYASRSAS